MVLSAPVSGALASLSFKNASDLAPVIVFAGEETFLAEEGIAAATKALFPEGDPGGAVVTLDAGNVSDAERIPAVLEELATPSLFGDGKLVVIRRAELLGGKAAASDDDDDDDDGEEGDDDESPRPPKPAPRDDVVELRKGASTSQMSAAPVAPKRKANPITALVKGAMAAQLALQMPGSVLILATMKPVKGKGSVSADAISKTGAMLVDCRRLYDSAPPWARGGDPTDTEVSKWVSKRAKVRHGKSMDLRTAHALSVRSGGGLAVLAKTLETLASYVGPRPAIVESDIAATVATTREDPAWVLADAVLDKDLGRALDLVEASFERGLSDSKGRMSIRPEAIFPPLVATLHGAWRRAMLVSEAAAKGENPAVLPAFAGLPSFVVERLIRQASKRAPADLLARHRAFIDAESGVRGGGVPPRLAVERLVIALIS